MLRFIPTPSIAFVGVGPFTIHFYALSILLGVVVALWIGKRRYQSMGGDSTEISEIALYAIPAGIIGGRLYHLVTSPDHYFGEGGKPWDAVKIWEGGLGIWGAIALGTLAAYICFRRRERSLPFAAFADALAPALLVAQGVGRFGNWFNGELYGKPSRLPWALEIPVADRVPGYEQFTTFHPTFLYEAIWCFLAALIIARLTRYDSIRGRALPQGSLFLLYITLYTFGRFWMELLRIDTSHRIFGARLNLWVDLVIFLPSFIFLLWLVLWRRRGNSIGYEHGS